MLKNHMTSSNTPVSIVDFCAVALYKSQAALSGGGFVNRGDLENTSKMLFKTS